MPRQPAAVLAGCDVTPGPTAASPPRPAKQRQWCATNRRWFRAWGPDAFKGACPTCRRHIEQEQQTTRPGTNHQGSSAGSLAPFVRIMLPVAERCRSDRHGLQVDYWAPFLVACPCCAETRPVRWCDAWHGDYGFCQACGLGRVPAWRAGGPRCLVHRRWDAAHTPNPPAEHTPVQPAGPLPVEGGS